MTDVLPEDLPINVGGGAANAERQKPERQSAACRTPVPTPIHKYFNGKPFSLPKRSPVQNQPDEKTEDERTEDERTEDERTGRNNELPVGTPYAIRVQPGTGVKSNPVKPAANLPVADPPFTDSRDWKRRVAVVDPRDQSTTNDTFLKKIHRELKIRNYAPNTVKVYGSAIRTFLDWAGLHFSCLTREHVCEYLEFMVDAGLTGTTLGTQLTAIRTCFDKFCLTDITLGLVTPRRPKKLPVVLSKEEIVELLEAAISLRDKLVLGLMYATGMRVSEVARAMFKDIDFDRNLINIWHGKHKVDRQVALPKSYRELLRSLVDQAGRNPYLFPSEQGDGRSKRHLSTRTIQRVLERTLKLTSIQKAATPHSLRHSFATHCFEDGCDIRRIQKVLGHANLETTTIYVHVAKPDDSGSLPSPIDRIDNGIQNPNEFQASTKMDGRQVGRLKVHARQHESDDATLVTVEIFVARDSSSRVFLTGILASQERPNFWTLRFPPIENWREAIGQLPNAVQKRIGEAEFYERMRVAIVNAL